MLPRLPCSSYLLQYWDISHIPPFPIYVVLNFEPRALCMLGKPSINLATCITPMKPCCLQHTHFRVKYSPVVLTVQDLLQ